MAIPWKFALFTFGCKVNQYETEAIREAWQNHGGIETQNVAEAEIILINSCAITARGEADARRALLRLRRQSPEARILFTGCAAALLASFSPKKGEKVMPDMLIPQSEKASLLSSPFTLLHKGTDTHSSKPLAHLTQQEPTLYPPFVIERYQRRRPVLKVQDGCSHRCTYCIVPTMRPRPTSRNPKDVLQEARTLFSKGYGECILSGINLAEYGKDHPEYGTFWDLIEYLDTSLASEFRGQARLRISSVSPAQLSERGLEVLAKATMICPHLHISLQHADPTVLRRMGRGHYKAEDLKKAINSIRSFWPVFGLGCDIIVGFPGENEASFATLMEYCQTIPFTYGHIFPYSRRPGTAAISFPNQIEEQVRKQRAAKVRTLFQEKKTAFLQMLLDTNAVLSVIGDDAESTRGTLQKCVSEYYTFCYCPPDSRLGLFKASPLRFLKDGLLVSPLD